MGEMQLCAHSQPVYICLKKNVGMFEFFLFFIFLFLFFACQRDGEKLMYDSPQAQSNL